MEHLQKTAYCESNTHVTYDVSDRERSRLRPYSCMV